MIFAEPPTTRFDVRFKVGRVPVRVHPFFWVSTIGLALRPDATMLSVALWLIAVLVSILVHELGHASAFRHFGWEPRITLYGFGGLASADSRRAGRRLTSRRKIFVSAAGPFAGFAFAAIVSVLVLRLGYRVPLVHWTIGSGPPIPDRTLQLLVFDAMTINVLWGLVNLLPVHPLDGGQIALELSPHRREGAPAHR
ncbi:MAG: metalloprotease [Polyangiaceae bacterium]